MSSTTASHAVQPRVPPCMRQCLPCSSVLAVILRGKHPASGAIERRVQYNSIEKIVAIDLMEHGDPIYAGMTQVELMSSAPKLAEQMPADCAPHQQMLTEPRESLSVLCGRKLALAMFGHSLHDARGIRHPPLDEVDGTASVCSVFAECGCSAFFYRHACDGNRPGVLDGRLDGRKACLESSQCLCRNIRRSRRGDEGCCARVCSAPR